MLPHMAPSCPEEAENLTPTFQDGAHLRYNGNRACSLVSYRRNPAHTCPNHAATHNKWSSWWGQASKNPLVLQNRGPMWVRAIEPPDPKSMFDRQPFTSALHPPKPTGSCWGQAGHQEGCWGHEARGGQELTFNRKRGRSCTPEPSPLSPAEVNNQCHSGGPSPAAVGSHSWHWALPIWDCFPGTAALALQQCIHH